MAPKTKQDSSLKQYLDTKKTPTRLLGSIERFILAQAEKERDHSVLHPSDLCKSDFCSRAAYYTITVGPKKDQVGFRLRNIFDEGHYIHAKWQNRLRDMGVLYGKWFCPACQHSWKGVGTVCPECSYAAIEYREVSLYDDALMIGGHTDGWVKDSEGSVLLEVKSIGVGTIRFEEPSLLAAHATLDEAWNNIRRPFSTHIRQGTLYLELLRRMEEQGIYEDVPDEIVFIYEKKSDQAVKEFVVKANPDIVKPMLDKAFDVQRAVRVTKTAPECSIDPINGCKLCKVFE
jgi:hypothetical protein